MRDKHNDVTKTERDRKAREIIRNFSLKNSQDIVAKLSQLTQAQQNQLQTQLLMQSGNLYISSDEKQKDKENQNIKNN